MRLLERSGLAAGRDQLRSRRCRADHQHRCSLTAISPACTSPAAPASSTACGRRSARTCPLPILSAHRRRNGRQGLHRRASVGGPAGAGRRDRARRRSSIRVRMLGGEPRLHPAVALARRARPRGRDDARHEDGRRPRLPEFHGRGDRQEGVRQDRRRTWRMRRRTRR